VPRTRRLAQAPLTSARNSRPNMCCWAPAHEMTPRPARLIQVTRELR
jgi:hypothetical protein